MRLHVHPTQPVPRSTPRETSGEHDGAAAAAFAVVLLQTGAPVDSPGTAGRPEVAETVESGDARSAIPAGAADAGPAGPDGVAPDAPTSAAEPADPTPGWSGGSHTAFVAPTPAGTVAPETPSTTRLGAEGPDVGTTPGATGAGPTAPAPTHEHPGGSPDGDPPVGGPADPTQWAPGLRQPAAQRARDALAARGTHGAPRSASGADDSAEIADAPAPGELPVPATHEPRSAHPIGATGAATADAIGPDPAYPAIPNAPDTPPDGEAARPVVVASSGSPRAVAPSSAPHLAPQAPVRPVAGPSVAPAARDAASDPVVVPPSPAEQLVAVVAPLRHRADGSYRVSLELHPRELGQVEVELHVERGVVHVAMHAEHTTTGELLREHLVDLRDRLDRAGVQAGSLNVDTGGADTPGRGFDRTAPVTTDAAPSSPTSTPSEPEATSPTTRGDSALDVRL
ncbi:MAG: flagellar hook-length control protein FliK [Acidimicrobiia bacterium]